MASEKGGGENVHMLISQTQTHRYNILQASLELVMQGEHIIAPGKISEGEGNESGRWIDLETQGREEATESE